MSDVAAAASGVYVQNLSAASPAHPSLHHTSRVDRKEIKKVGHHRTWDQKRCRSANSVSRHELLWCCAGGACCVVPSGDSAVLSLFT